MFRRNDIRTPNHQEPHCCGSFSFPGLPESVLLDLLDAGKLLGKGNAGVLDVFVRVFPGDDVEVAVALR